MRKSAAALFLLLSTAAMAADAPPTETVTVTASALAGIWKISHPMSAGKAGLFAPVQWGKMRDIFCRFEATPGGLLLYCRQPYGQSGTVTLDRAHIHIAWGSMMARFVIDGTLRSESQFDGRYQVKLSGITAEDPEPSGGTKVTIDDSTSDKGGKSQLLRTILTEGVTRVPHDSAAIGKGESASPDIAKLGAIQTIAYLGQETKFGDGKTHPDQPDFYTLYAVEFDGGERICSLHQRTDGVLDEFRCI